MTDPTVRLTVRRARLQDAEPIRHLYIELANERVDALPAGLDLTREVLAEIAARPDRLLLVGEVDGGEIAGTVDVVIVPNLTHEGRSWAIVENVVVLSHYRRQGIGHALMQEAIRHARLAGCYKVQLLSGKQREEAHDFYRSLGFDAIAEGFKIYLAQ